MDTTDEYIVEQANKVLRSIKSMQDLYEIEVSNPEGLNEKYCTVEKWIVWYKEKCEWFGVGQTDIEVIKLLSEIRSKNSIVFSRCVELLRMLFTLIDKQNTKIEELTNDLEAMTSPVIVKDQKSIGDFLPIKSIIKKKPINDFDGLADVEQAVDGGDDDRDGDENNA